MKDWLINRGVRYFKKMGLRRREIPGPTLQFVVGSRNPGFMQKNKGIKTAVVLAMYAIAMALVEAAVVVYLRELYYPGGFLIRSANDLKTIPLNMLRVEVWREIATLVMLALVGYLAFSSTRARLAAFVFAFSLWDLGYYLFLYLFLRWPSSLTTLDVYFLLPWPLVGPVWFPLLLFGGTAVISLRLLRVYGSKLMKR